MVDWSHQWTATQPFWGKHTSAPAGLRWKALQYNLEAELWFIHLRFVFLKWSASNCSWTEATGIPAQGNQCHCYQSPSWWAAVPWLNPTTLSMCRPLLAMVIFRRDQAMMAWTILIQLMSFPQPNWYKFHNGILYLAQYHNRTLFKKLIKHFS